MFGSLGGPEIILLFMLALLLFGPRRLPEIGRTLGKAMADFRRATTDFKISLEREVEIERVKEAAREVETLPRVDTLARGMLREVAAPTEPPEPEAGDGGPGSVH